eukprot:9483142-Pyramimonas_sp.AAC.1
MWQHPEAKPFLCLSTYLKEAKHKPKVALLENVDGIRKRDPGATSDYTTPMEFVLRGIAKESGHRGHRNVGLEYLPDYDVVEMEFSSRDAGFPHLRNRIYFLCVLKYITGLGGGKDKVFNKIRTSLNALADDRSVQYHIQDFLIEDEVDAVVPKKWRKSSRSSAMTVDSILLSDRARADGNLELRGTPAGRPFQTCAPASTLAELTLREQDIADIALLRALQRNSPGLVQCGRQPERHGGLLILWRLRHADVHY